VLPTLILKIDFEDSSVIAGARETQVLRDRHLDLMGFGDDVF
jgi:hypothetical protein